MLREGCCHARLRCGCFGRVCEAKHRRCVGGLERSPVGQDAIFAEECVGEVGGIRVGAVGDGKHGESAGSNGWAAIGSDERLVF